MKAVLDEDEERELEGSFARHFESYISFSAEDLFDELGD